MLRETCKRFTSTPIEMQSWLVEVPWDTEELECEYFMPNESAREEEIW